MTAHPNWVKERAEWMARPVFERLCEIVKADVEAMAEHNDQVGRRPCKFEVSDGGHELQVRCKEDKRHPGGGWFVVVLSFSWAADQPITIRVYTNTKPEETNHELLLGWDEDTGRGTAMLNGKELELWEVSRAIFLPLFFAHLEKKEPA